jgi:ABC-type cobalamin/Fe3+-siderophores transport system ATPase subunit/coproporphyrinogen III oxidase-like Fe-S oxidoreductase
VSASVAVRDLDFAWGERTVLREISLSLRPGEMVGLLGPNGSGKSTFLKNLLGFLKPSRGRIVFAGLGENPAPKKLARRLALVPQNSPWRPMLPVKEFILMGRLPHLKDRWTGYDGEDRRKTSEVMAVLGLAPLADRFVTELSGGEFQKAVIGRCLVQEGDILLLDEVTTGLDLNHTIEIMELMRRKADGERTAILAVLHDLTLAAQYCDRLVLLKDGRICRQGRPPEVITAEAVETVYGVRAAVHTDEKGRPYVLPRRADPAGAPGVYSEGPGAPEKKRRTTVFTERYRSHHDAESRLAAALAPGGAGGAGHPAWIPKGSSGAAKYLAPLMRRLAGVRARSGGTRAGMRDCWPEVEKILRDGGPAAPAAAGRGVYIHVPYCDRICTFCNLNRKGTQKADLEGYAAYLSAEIERWALWPYIQRQEFDAVYFGGGTPTVLGADRLSRILGTLRRCFPLKRDCEITVESTQHNLPAEDAAALEAAGVTRFSVGIQTFSEAGRKLLGRTWNQERAVGELAALRAAFSGTLGIDLIYSYPGQRPDEAAFDAETFLASGADSVSFYSLMIHQGSALAAALEAGKIAFDRDTAFDRERHHLLYHTLKAGGLDLLELSKMIRPGRDRYRYIGLQYGGDDLVPLGSGAGGRIAGYPIYSMAPGRRFVSAADRGYGRYYRILGLLQFGRYDPAVITEGLEPEAAEAVREKLRDFAAEGFLEAAPRGPGWVLSADGVFWGNNLAVEVLETAIHAERGRAQKKEAS